MVAGNYLLRFREAIEMVMWPNTMAIRSADYIMNWLNGAL